MKNIFKLVLCFAITTAILSCKKNYFDTIPDNLVTTEGVFTNLAQTEKWLGGLYSTIEDPWDQPYNYTYGITTDELDASNWTNPAMNSGALNANSVLTGNTREYEKIRLCSIFLENIDKNEELKQLANSEEIIRNYKGEAQFLRAYYYWVMMKRLGPVVILPLQSSNADSDFQIPRSSWDECVKFVLSEINSAKQNLPVDNYIIGTLDIDPRRVGRINRIIATAVESQILLYHASPLFNGNTEFADFKNLDGKVLFNQTYDGNRWSQAARAAKSAIDLAESNGRALYRVADPDAFRAAFLSCRDLFWNGWKTEGIWLRPSSANANWETNVSPRSIQGTAFNGIGVVQNLIDDFRMSDGKSIQASTTYNENTYSTQGNSYYVAGTNSMYQGREARFYANVTFNGAVHCGVPKSGLNRVEFFNTGTSGKSGAPRDWPKTGYTPRKNIHPTYSRNPSVLVSRPAMLIRLAELYLNYAEALNESEPQNPDVLKYLNLVRTRGGLPNLLTGLSQEQIREQIRIERRIELCFENGARYFDVRRWKLPTQRGFSQGGEFFGMNMDGGTSLSDPVFHRRTLAFSRAAWSRKNYFYPYGQDEMDRNKQLVQIPGY